ncbi:IucA/IucC family protein [Rossellomorea sp. YZS02]|uniref:IucA/IucC family protein n=1 Tax=Rossellomorea sp. YZS02 TaxID=3097358 RepID=UPI002A163749|nr:IucA/IucC family protein [Rossellomorea sp. YZS02]MDX8345632.1 IucA/IucC family protein [Rossellomorea sp. YZS02]
MTLSTGCHSEQDEYNRIQKLANEKLKQSETRILNKLMQAMIREGLIQYTYETTEENVKLIYITPVKNVKITVPIENSYFLGQLDIGGRITVKKEGSITQIHTPTQLIKELFPKVDSRQLELLINELEDSVKNDALALAAEELQKDLYSGIGTFEYLHRQSSNPEFSPLVFLEQSVIEGHTLHPCSKTRLGLTGEEVMKYAPEWKGEVNVHPVAIHKDISSFSTVKGGPTMTEILLKEYPAIEIGMKRQFKELQKDLKDYEIIPVHPWQFEHIVKCYFKEELIQGLLIPIDMTIPSQPLISFRSLAPHNRRHHHLKTALNVQMTSAKRIVSPTSVWNGPIISELLNIVCIHDPEIKEKIHFLSECGGGHYRSHRIETSINLEKNLSALIRENPEKKLEKGQIAVPGAALINTSPVSGKVLSLEIIEKWSIERNVSVEAAAVRFIHEYSNTLIPGLIHLIIKYGVSLEAHLQNAIMIFENDCPKTLMIRDNGGIRILKNRLPVQCQDGRISNKTNLLTTEAVDLYKMFSHAVLHNHLGEIIVGIIKDTGLSEGLLWEQVAEVIQSTIDSIKEDAAHCKNASQFEQEIFGPVTYLKSLIKMRLSNAFTENVYISAPNPLTRKGNTDEVTICKNQLA